MADLIIIENDVKLGTTDEELQTTQIKFGATVTKGQPVYPLGDLYHPTDASTEVNAAADGITFVGGTVGETGQMVTRGPITIGAALTAGDGFTVSANPGGIAAEGDLLAGQKLTRLGYALNTTQIFVAIEKTTVSIP